MYIVFGGAYNGKRQYVKDQLEGQAIDWHEGSLPETAAANGIAVIAGLEHWVKQQIEQGFSEEQLMEQVRKAVNGGQAQKFWILTDLNRGIVPTERIEREMRDVIGRLYQFLFSEAEEVTRIWYGIPEKIKGADKDEDLHENRR